MCALACVSLCADIRLVAASDARFHVHQMSGGQSLVGIGPSGSGKTRLLFDIASKHPALYFECAGRCIDQDDTFAFSNVMKSAKNLTEVDRTFKAEHHLQCLITARHLLLEHFAAHVGQRIADWTSNVCRRWLMAQLNGGTKISKDLFLVLIRGERTTVESICESCITRMQVSPVLLFDEAHGWHDESAYGTFLTSTNTCAFAGERPTLFTRASFLMRQLQFNSLWVGTALSIGDLRPVQSAMMTMITDSLHNHIVAGFRAMSPNEVKAVLRYFLRISDPTVQILAGELAGRGRLSSEFLVYCWLHGARTDEDVVQCFDEFRTILLAIPNNFGEPNPIGQARCLSDAWETLLLNNRVGKP